MRRTELVLVLGLLAPTLAGAGRPDSRVVSALWAPPEAVVSHRIYGFYRTKNGTKEGIAELSGGHGADVFSGTALSMWRFENVGQSEQLYVAANDDGPESGSVHIERRDSRGRWQPVHALPGVVSGPIGMQGVFTGQLWVYGATGPADQPRPLAAFFDGTSWTDTDVSALPHPDRILAMLPVGPDLAFAVLSEGLGRFDRGRWSTDGQPFPGWLEARVNLLRVFGVDRNGELSYWVLGMERAEPVVSFRGGAHPIWSAASTTDVWEFRGEGAYGVVSHWDGTRWTDVLKRKGLAVTAIEGVGGGEAWVESSRGLLSVRADR